MHKIVSEDNFIWKEHQLIMYLYQCIKNNTDPIIDFYLEGPSADANGLYQILDDFCKKNNYPKEKITIQTGNLIEKHNHYGIKKIYDYWYEIKLLQDWTKTRNLTTDNTSLTKHFGSFVGRSTWARAWVAAHLHNNHKEKTLQTFHSGLHKNYVIPSLDGVYDNLGLDNLNRYGCNTIAEVLKFLESCPIVLNDDFDADNPYIAPSNKNYPIQHPANMNIIYWYKHFCIDIITETRVVGDSFFCTEKTWRPIIAQRPFIVVGTQNFLKNLKKLGFKTFNDFWDEGYDDFGSIDRIQNIILLINNLANKPISDIQKIVTDANQILDYNYKIFQSLTYEKIMKVFDE